jgi:hypothetical protein
MLAGSRDGLEEADKRHIEQGPGASKVWKGIGSTKSAIGGSLGQNGLNKAATLLCIM